MTTYEEAKMIIEKGGDAVVLDETEMTTVQEIINAVSGIPGIWPQISAWMRALGFEDPDCNMDELRKKLF